MKLTKFMFPYPVLGLEGAFKDACRAESSMTFETEPESFCFNIEFEIDDLTILSMIQAGTAAFACEVDCAKTYYREIFKTKLTKFRITIPRVSLVGQVNFFFSVVLLDSVDGYTSENFNEHFYTGYKFNLQKGHLLAYLGERVFNANIKYDELKAIGSIVEVKEDPHQDHTYYDFSSEKIRIFLPSEDFANFNRSNNPSWADITHASIVQCGLISALHEFKAYSRKEWAQTLRLRVKTEPALANFENLEDLDAAQISQLVNILLENPNKRMFETIDTLRNNI